MGLISYMYMSLRPGDKSLLGCLFKLLLIQVVNEVYSSKKDYSTSCGREMSQRKQAHNDMKRNRE